VKKRSGVALFSTALWIAAGLMLHGCQAPAPEGRRSLRDFDARARALVAGMTLDEKIGQMTQAEQSGLEDPDDIAKYFLGSVLCGGNSDPKEGNALEAWTAMVDDAQARAVSTRLGIPLLYGVDAVHGHNNVLGATIFPHNIGLGATRDPDLVEAIARATAKEVRATGINWTFAPCVTVPRDARWGRTYEGFSDDPALVAELGAAAVRGFQGDDLSNPLSILACAKHFVADGGTAFGTGSSTRSPLDQGDTQVDEATLRRIHLPPYPAAIDAGVGSIMPSYSSWNGVKCSASRRLLTEILKEELGFEGFLISDYNAIDQIDPEFKTAVATSINAGMDMAMAPNRYVRFIETLKALVNEGTVPMERIDDAVVRILRVKLAMGLMDKDDSPAADRRLHATFGSAEHRALARRAVAESLVVMKNERGVLPIAKTARIHVAGKSADDIGNQCGGWTITWQGRGGPVTDGTTILEGIREVAGPAGRVTGSIDASGAAGADVAVVVIGERPYAEGNGDRANLSLDAEDIQAVRNARAAGVPVVAVFVSGRPLDLGEVEGLADAIVEAGLPGSEGAGVADVLLGQIAATGRPSFRRP
jgi:beta-glucosidase